MIFGIARVGVLETIGLLVYTNLSEIKNDPRGGFVPPRGSFFCAFITYLFSRFLTPSKMPFKGHFYFGIQVP